jgi:hypothetical protein
MNSEFRKSRRDGGEGKENADRGNQQEVVIGVRREGARQIKELVDQYEAKLQAMVQVLTLSTQKHAEYVKRL